MTLPIALTIAGSDPSGGAGIQADLKTFAAHGVYGLSVITAITAQNTMGVQASWALDVHQVQAQLTSLLADIKVDVVKIGMLGSAEIVKTVAGILDGNYPLVIDPVIASTSGKALLQPSGVASMVNELFAQAVLVTPNLLETAKLLGRPVTTVSDMRSAAKELQSWGPEAVLIKGGHLNSAEAVDILYWQGNYITFNAGRLDNPNTHGTGCTFSSAIAANLAQGFDLNESVAKAKNYITQAIAGGFSIGKGIGPTNHFFAR